MGGLRLSCLYVRGVRPDRLVRDSEILSRTILADGSRSNDPSRPLDDLRLSRREIDDAKLWCPAVR